MIWLEYDLSYLKKNFMFQNKEISSVTITKTTKSTVTTTISERKQSITVKYKSTSSIGMTVITTADDVTDKLITTEDNSEIKQPPTSNAIATHMPSHPTVSSTVSPFVSTSPPLSPPLTRKTSVTTKLTTRNTSSMMTKLTRSTPSTSVTTKHTSSMMTSMMTKLTRSTPSSSSKLTSNKQSTSMKITTKLISTTTDKASTTLQIKPSRMTILDYDMETHFDVSI